MVDKFLTAHKQTTYYLLFFSFSFPLSKSLIKSLFVLVCCGSRRAMMLFGPLVSDLVRRGGDGGCTRGPSLSLRGDHGAVSGRVSRESEAGRGREGGLRQNVQGDRSECRGGGRGDGGGVPETSRMMGRLTFIFDKRRWAVGDVDALCSSCCIRRTSDSSRRRQKRREALSLT